MSNTKRMASNIDIQWNPVNDDGVVNFNFNNYLLDDMDNPTEFIDPNEQRSVQETIQQITGRQINESGQITDPVTQEVLPAISGSGLMMLIKATVDQIRNELENEILVSQNPHLLVSQNPPSETQCEMAINPPVVPSDNTTEGKITLQLKKDDGTPITWGGYDIQFETNLGELIGEVYDNEDGMYTQRIRSSDTGVADIIAYVDSTVQIGNVSIEFIEYT